MRKGSSPKASSGRVRAVCHALMTEEVLLAQLQVAIVFGANGGAEVAPDFGRPEGEELV